MAGKIASPKTFLGESTYFFKRNSPTDGGLAQLGERLNGIQKVDGSSPLSSTNINPCVTTSYAGVLCWISDRITRSRLCLGYRPGQT